MEQYVYVILAVIIGVIITSLYHPFSPSNKGGGTVSNEEIMKLAEERLKQVAEDHLLRVTEKLDSKVALSSKDLEAKKDNIMLAISNIQGELKQNQDKFIKSDENMAMLKTIIEQHQKVTESLSDKTENLSKVLSSNQMRGQLGQKVAEDLLRSSGFVKGKNFEIQTQLSSSKSIPDITILFPDGTKLNVDVKFPFQALSRYQQTEDVQQKAVELAQFKADVKAKIKEITTRDYINPAEKTLDFVVMFIPSEVVFGFIMDKYDDLVEEAFQKKVIMCGPFGFTAIIRMVQQANDNFAYQQNLYQIIDYIKEFEAEYSKFNAALEVLGTRLDSTKKQYDLVSTTRTNSLNRIVRKIKTEEPSLLEGASDNLNN